jgi:hypothetical protein
VRGTTSDDGPVKRVVVNDREVVTVRDFAQWEGVLDGVLASGMRLTASAEAAAGNIEKRPHTRGMED